MLEYTKKLYQKQLEILKQIKDGHLVPLGTGTGKTLIGLHYYINHHIEKPLIIFCPLAKYLEKGWEREAKELAEYYGIEIPKITVVPYSRLNKFKAEKDFFAILDEAHYIKNPTATRSKTIKDIIKNQPFIMLTATPGTKVEDYAHYFMLWGKFKFKTHFEHRYLIREVKDIRGARFLYTAGYQNMEEFNQTIKEHSSSRLTVNDIVELPSLIITNEYFIPSDEYKQIKKDRVIRTDDEIILLDTQIKLCTYLRQYTNRHNKIEKIKTIVSECKETKENLLIFYNFNSELEEIEKALTPDFIINGKVKKFPIKEEFENLNSTITVVQIQAGGTGIELQYCSRVVFYSPTYSFQDYEQAMGRTYRPNQKNKVLVQQFNTIDSIEHDVWQALAAKKDFDEKMWEAK